MSNKMIVLGVLFLVGVSYGQQQPVVDNITTFITRKSLNYLNIVYLYNLIIICHWNYLCQLGNFFMSRS